ncbi:MAG: D-glycero-beta-D-manno-heptose 1-phosphate adenylyltransferase [Candidatus Omnitrophica bacterium]|nr:D-glycero-beta-D-manno-heptose 1-phosphate adenylyltransferase [Candidatus Omnitrophota bacterium]
MLKDKIKSRVGLERIVSGLKRRGRRIVFTNGCFDLLHFGHARYLEQAKRFGDILIVGVNSDSSVRKIKGKKRPIVKERDRASLIAALESVDFVTIFSEPTPLRLIQRLKPDVLIKGADWNKKGIVGEEFVKGRGGRVATVKLERGRSTTGLIGKIAKTF